MWCVKTIMVQVPDALLHHRLLGKSAKLLWLILALDARTAPAAAATSVTAPAASPVAAAPRPGRLQALSGLARHTVLRGLRQLQAAGWLTPAPHQPPTPRQGEACLPGDLLHDGRVSVQAKLLYASLQRTPGFSASAGQCTYAQLSHLTGLGPNTVKRAVRALQETGWLTISQRNKFSPIHFVLRNPAAERRAEATAQVQRRLNRAPYLGEALMREYLTLIVDSDEYDDDASPGFLINPYTGEELQFDRYYPPGVAFEFQGPQHYGPTDLYAEEADIRKQQARDYIKRGISASRGIHLAVVHPEDLTLAGMCQKVQGLLPLRQLDGHELAIAYLEQVSRAYRRKARRPDRSRSA